jgi:hypothetical protein
VETRILGEVHRCKYHRGRVGVDKHPCEAVIDRLTGERCGYSEGEGQHEGLSESRIISGQMDMLNYQCELEVRA